MKHQSAVLCLVAAFHASTAYAQTTLDAAVLAFAKKQGVQTLPNYRVGLVDLNNDGTEDALVLLTGPDWCGSGGCTLVIFRGAGNSFALVSSSSVTLEPIRVLREYSKGWSKLLVHSRGRGEVVLNFDGKKYPGNPSRAPVASPLQLQAAEVLIE